jgi:hypothetical protein
LRENGNGGKEREEDKRLRGEKEKDTLKRVVVKGATGSIYLKNTMQQHIPEG